MSENKPTQILANLSTLLPELESVYKDVHSHPELSMQENRTAAIAADHLRAAGYDVTTGGGNRHGCASDDRRWVVYALSETECHIGTARHGRARRHNQHPLRRDHLCGR